MRLTLIPINFYSIVSLVGSGGEKSESLTK